MSGQSKISEKRTLKKEKPNPGGAGVWQLATKLSLGFADFFQHLAG